MARSPEPSENPQPGETSAPPQAPEAGGAPLGDAAAAPPAPAAQLELALEQARRRIDELARAYQAVEQDREEFKRRVQRERERMVEVEKAEVAVVLLEAIDELELCLGAAGPSALAQGVRLIRDGLLKKAEGLGLERVTLVGRPFDPNLAEAADLEVTGLEEDDQKVVAELRAAWRLKDRVVRPGRVRVARYQRPARA